MMRRWRYGSVRLPARHFHCCWDQVILEIAAQDVTTLIIGDLFVECWRESLREATMHLPLNDHGIDDRPTVIDCHEAANMDLPGSTVDIDHTDVAAEGIGEVGRVIVADGLQSRLQKW